MKNVISQDLIQTVAFLSIGAQEAMDDLNETLTLDVTQRDGTNRRALHPLSRIDVIDVVTNWGPQVEEIYEHWQAEGKTLTAPFAYHVAIPLGAEMIKHIAKHHRLTILNVTQMTYALLEKAGDYEESEVSDEDLANIDEPLDMGLLVPESTDLQSKE